MSDRSWAVGLSQPDFEREYLRKWPHADVIPLGTEWVLKEDLTYRSIDAPDPEKFEMDGPAVQTDKRKIAKQFPCRGCGRPFGFAIARSGHERGCKVKIKKEAVNE